MVGTILFSKQPVQNSDKSGRLLVACVLSFSSLRVFYKFSMLIQSCKVRK